MRIAILGGPGSGKGTQAKMLAEKYRVPQISTGDLLRDAIKTDKTLGKEIKQCMDCGQLVDDEVVLKLLEDRLRNRDAKRGFIIDGYPRNIPQAQALDTLLGMLGRSLQIAINIDAGDDMLVKRITGRVSCVKCGAIYNRHFSPPKVRGKCDACGGRKFESRSDDTAKTARARIGVYHRETAPLITYYRAQHKLRTMTGTGKIDEIHRKLCDIVDLEIRPLEIKTLEVASETGDELESTVIAGGRVNRVETETKKKKLSRKKKRKTSRAPIKKITKKTPAKSVVKPKKVRKKTTKTTAAASKKSAGKKKTPKKVTRKVTKKPVRKKKISKKAAKKTAAKKVIRKKAAKSKTKVSKKKAGKKKRRNIKTAG